MANKNPRQKTKQVLLDPDILGFGSAAFFGTLVMALGFWKQVDAFVVAERTGLTAVVAYAVTFIFVRYLQGIADRLAREKWRREEEERRAQAAIAAAQAEQEGGEET